MQNSSGEGIIEPHPGGNRTTKKERFKDGLDGETSNMAANPVPTPVLSWKDKLLGREDVGADLDRFDPPAESENEIELLEGNVNTPLVNGVPTIA